MVPGRRSCGRRPVCSMSCTCTDRSCTRLADRVAVLLDVLLADPLLDLVAVLFAVLLVDRLADGVAALFPARFRNLLADGVMAFFVAGLVARLVVGLAHLLQDRLVAGLA